MSRIVRYLTVQLVLLLAFSSGCTQTHWDEFVAFFQRDRSAVQPQGKRPSHTVARRAEQSQSQSQKKKSRPQRPPSPEKRSAKAAPATSSSPPADGETQVFYRLELINEPSAAETPPRVARLWLKSAKAGPAARLIEVLYAPIGTGGSETQHYLVYQSPVMWKAAQNIAKALDVKPADDVPQRIPADVRDAFRKGLALTQLVMAPGKLNKPALDKSIELFNHVAVKDSASPKLRWAAAIFAGRLSADFAFNSEAAREYFHLAQGHAPEKSVERMTALYYRAEVLRQSNRSAEAAPILAEITEQFNMHADTNLYQRCQRLAMK